MFCSRSKLLAKTLLTLTVANPYREALKTDALQRCNYQTQTRESCNGPHYTGDYSISRPHSEDKRVSSGREKTTMGVESVLIKGLAEDACSGSGLHE